MTDSKEQRRKDIREARNKLTQLQICKMKDCKTRENSNFLKNGKMVISVKIQNFYRSRKSKRTSPLESSCKI